MRVDRKNIRLRNFKKVLIKTKHYIREIIWFIFSLLSYKNYKSFIKDIQLIGESDLFNTRYYLTYQPYLSKCKNILYLHYLTHGGYNTKDPGPIFDSSWYLDNYTDAKMSGINPLIHYLNIGKAEERRKNCGSELRIIEFIGLSGSGKSTLYKRINAHLSRKVGYLPGPAVGIMNLDKDIRYRALMGLNLNSNLEKKYKIGQLMDAYEEAVEHYPFPDYFPENRAERVGAFISMLTRYIQQVDQDKTKPWLMFDEGIHLYLVRFILNKDRIPEVIYNRIVDSLPKLDVLIFVKTAPEICIKRMKERGIPGPFQGLADDLLYSHFLKGDKAYSNFIDLMRSSGTTTITVDNNGSLDESFLLLKNELSALKIF